MSRIYEIFGTNAHAMTRALLESNACAELKDAAQKWLDTMEDGAANAEATKNYIAALEDGLVTVDELAERARVPVQKLKHRALTNTLEVGGVKVLLMKPVTYMNLSGEAVGEAARFYKLPPERVLVISDDVSLPVGKLRIRKGGSAGGHNGLKSIIQHLGTDQFPRIKVGVGQKPHPDYDMADWVLSKFAGEDLKTITEAIRKAADAVECLIQEGPDKAMNRFNG